MTVLGTETTLVTYHGRTRFDDTGRAVAVHVAQVEHRGDVVTLVAVTPRDGASLGPFGPLFRSVSH